MPLLNVAGFTWRFVSSERNRRKVVTLRPSFEMLEDRCVLSSPGQVIEPGITIFKLDRPDIRPDQILVGPDGDLWFNEVLSNRIGKKFGARQTHFLLLLHFLGDEICSLLLIQRSPPRF